MEYNSENKYIVDLKFLNTYNAKGCEACHQKFKLGDTVVQACGPWQDGCTRFIHEKEAVFDSKTRTWYERNYFRTLGSA